MELNNSKYIEQKLNNKLYIYVFYEAARHRLFITPK